MSTEVKKRGRPRKVVEELGTLPTEKIPKSKDLSTKARKATRKTSAAANPTSGSNETGDLSTAGVTGSEDGLKSHVIASSSVNREESLQDIPPPPIVARLFELEKSRVLEEIVKTEGKRVRKPQISKERKLAIRKEAKLEEVIPPLKQQAATPAAHLQPVNTLAMGYPIPTYQSARQTVGPRASYCLPWLPNPPTLPQASYLSTTARFNAAGKRKVPSLKEVNKYFVTEQSSRGGPGSGAARSRAQQAAEEARGSAKPGLLMNEEIPAKYKPALRRVQAIIVALPIVIVTSWMLYERQFLGAEQKKLNRLPSGSDAISQSASISGPSKSA